MSGSYQTPAGVVERDPTRAARRGGRPSTGMSRTAVASSSRVRDNTIPSYWQNAREEQRTAATASLGPFPDIAELEVTPTVAAPTNTDTAQPEAMQGSQPTEEATVHNHLQAQVDSIDNKRDREDPDFVEAQVSLKRARVHAASETPATPSPSKPRRGRAVKRYDNCTPETKTQRRNLVKAISMNWRVPHAEWLTNDITPKGESKEWGVPLLKQLRRLSELTRNDAVRGRTLLSTAVIERTGGGNGTLMLIVEDVETAISALSVTQEQRAYHDRSPTLAPAAATEHTDSNIRSHAYRIGATAVGAVQDAIGAAQQLPSPRSPTQLTASSSRRAEKQPIKAEPVAEHSNVAPGGVGPPGDELQDILARIEEIGRLRTEEAKAKMLRLVLEAKHGRWEALQSHGSSFADAVSGEAVGD